MLEYLQKHILEEIKGQDRLTDAQAKIVSQQTEISNNAQTQYLLAQMGKWVANAPAAAGA